MFSVAYGMLGSATEAEDVTQEAVLRLHREPGPIESPAAFAVTVTTRLAIDQLRSARARREVYVGAGCPSRCVMSDPASEPAVRSRSPSGCRSRSWCCWNAVACGAGGAAVA